MPLVHKTNFFSKVLQKAFGNDRMAHPKENLMEKHA